MFPFPVIAPARVSPAPFSFPSVVNVAISTWAYSAAITPTGFDTGIFVTVDNGAETSVGGGAWSTLAKLVQPGQTVQVRMFSSTSWNTTKSTTVTIGGVSTTWSVQTGQAASGAWDTGWTAGSWTVYTPQFFNWFRVQLWAAGGGGGGGADAFTYLDASDGSAGQDGGDGGHASFNNGMIYATGGGRGTGGFGGVNAGPVIGSPGYTTSHGSGVGGDSNVYAGGAAGGGGGYGAPWNPSWGYFHNGGNGGTGGYVMKTWQWGQLGASTAFNVTLGGPGGGGQHGWNNVYRGYNGLGVPTSGVVGAPGRCYIDWG